jgi:hypothetical protein
MAALRETILEAARFLPAARRTVVLVTAGAEPDVAARSGAE